VGFKKSLLESGEREARLYLAQLKTIVAESMGGSSEATLVYGSGGLRAVGEGEKRGGAAVSRSGGSGAERLVVRLGRHWNLASRFGSGSDGDAVRGSAGVRFFFDAHQILIRDFPAEVLVLSALFEILFEEDGTAGIGDESARSGQEDIAGAILHLNATPEKGGVASHPLPSVRVEE
jgi:hypothetical protein